MSNIVHAKFSKSLRGQAQWHILGPCLVGSTVFRFQESDSTESDLLLPLTSHSGSPALHVFLVWSAEATACLASKIQARLPSEASRGNHYLIVLPAEQVDERRTTQLLQQFSLLQKSLLKFPPIPAVMVQSIDSLLPTLEHYLDELKKPSAPNPQPVPLLSTLMAQAISTAPSRPLSEHDANVLVDLFPSIRLLEEATRTSNGRSTIAEYFDPSKARSMAEFWEDDWIV